MIYFDDEEIADCYIEENIILIDDIAYKIVKSGAKGKGVWVVEL